MPPQNIHCLTVIPHPPGPCSALRNFPWRACYHAYGSCEAILPLRSLVLADKTLPPWQVCQRASACSAICNPSLINNCIVWIARAHLQKRMSIYVVLAMGCWSLVLFATKKHMHRVRTSRSIVCNLQIHPYFWPSKTQLPLVRLQEMFELTTLSKHFIFVHSQNLGCFWHIDSLALFKAHAWRKPGEIGRLGIALSAWSFRWRSSVVAPRPREAIRICLKSSTDYQVFWENCGQILGVWFITSHQAHSQQSSLQAFNL